MPFSPILLYYFKGIICFVLLWHIRLLLKRCRREPMSWPSMWPPPTTCSAWRTSQGSWCGCALAAWATVTLTRPFSWASSCGRSIHDGFSYIGNTGPYEVSKKLHTLRQSLGKVEDACYTLRVRGSEIPKHMLADVFTSRTTMMDPEEGVV